MNMVRFHDGESFIETSIEYLKSRCFKVRGKDHWVVKINIPWASETVFPVVSVCRYVMKSGTKAISVSLFAVNMEQQDTMAVHVFRLRTLKEITDDPKHLRRWAVNEVLKELDRIWRVVDRLGRLSRFI